MLWLLPAASAQQSISETLTVRALAPGVHAITATPWQASSLVVEMADSTLVLVDTPPTPVQTEAVLAWMEERYGVRPIVAVVSHHHIDASGGNQVLAAAGVPIYGGSLTPVEQSQRATGILASLSETFADDPVMSEQLSIITPTPPDHTFPIEGTLTLTFGADTLTLIHPGHAHSADNIVAWFPTKGLLFGGCMVKDGESLGYVGEADEVSWRDAIEVLIALSPDVVIPGHGPRTDPGLLTNTRRLLTPAER
ncbi:MAG: glyoxylase-like metal-dependent hydrolase (beta-lactamase superfamily II) [Myxococcota bacterium]|jgi:glyoxylase-like metal-dependent hydrolase (beta-lactamase superfamily II)